MRSRWSRSGSPGRFRNSSSSRRARLASPGASSSARATATQCVRPKQRARRLMPGSWTRSCRRPRRRRQEGAFASSRVVCCAGFSTVVRLSATVPCAVFVWVAHSALGVARLQITPELTTFWRTLDRAGLAYVGEEYAPFEGDPRAAARSYASGQRALAASGPVRRSLGLRYVPGLTPGYNPAVSLGGTSTAGRERRSTPGVRAMSRRGRVAASRASQSSTSTSRTVPSRSCTTFSARLRLLSRNRSAAGFPRRRPTHGVY